MERLWACVEALLPGHYRIELTLAEAKARRFVEIDHRTDALIASGFSFRDMRFSLSLEAQARLQFMNSEREMLQYPVVYNSVDDNSALTLTEAAEVRTFALTAAGTLRYYLDTGTALKQLVRDAGSTADVQAVMDTRGQ